MTYCTYIGVLSSPPIYVLWVLDMLFLAGSPRDIEACTNYYVYVYICRGVQSSTFWPNQFMNGRPP